MYNGNKKSNNCGTVSNTLLYFNKIDKLNKYPDGTGESGTFVPRPIDTGFNRNLESENRNSLKTENQLSLAVD